MYMLSVCSNKMHLDKHSVQHPIEAYFTWSCAVPAVNSEVVVTCDSNDGRDRYGRVGVSRDVSHGRVGQELHDHTDVFLDRGKHHGGLEGKPGSDGGNVKPKSG